MFSNKKVNPTKIDTLIGKNTKLDGTINTKGTIRLDGILNGDLIAEGNITIGESGQVLGNIQCTNIIICGLVKGNIITTGQLRITNKGKLLGDIEVNNIIVDENATFEGSCKMKTKQSNKPIESKTSKATDK